MKKLLVLILLAAAGWHFYPGHSASPVITNIAADGSTLGSPVVIQPALSWLSVDRLFAWLTPENSPVSTTPSRPAPQQASASRYRCDGRTHCSQMTSCEEARFFLHNCPATKMDGNRDGVPCEQQWCR